MTVADRVRGYVDIVRPTNAVAAGVLTFVGSFVGGGVADHRFAVAAAIGATVFATAAGNTINDYFDREVDEINDPDRPIPRGDVSPRGALAYSTALFVGAVALALSLPPLAIAIAVVNLAALIAYTEVFKGLPGAGNAVVAYLGGSTFLFGGAAVGNVAPTVVLFVLAALSTLSREIIKDVEDLAGDRAEGLTTLPVAVGKRQSLWVAAALLGVAVLASPVPYLLSTFGVGYLVAVLPADAVMLWSAATGFDDAGRGHRRLKYGMFLAAAAFVVGRLVAVGAAP